MSALTDATAAVKAEVDRLIADMGQKITDAVTVALAANSADEATSVAVLGAVKDEIEAFDPTVVPPPAA